MQGMFCISLCLCVKLTVLAVPVREWVSGLYFWIRRGQWLVNEPSLSQQPCLPWSFLFCALISLSISLILQYSTSLPPQLDPSSPVSSSFPPSLCLIRSLPLLSFIHPKIHWSDHSLCVCVCVKYNKPIHCFPYMHFAVAHRFLKILFWKIIFRVVKCVQCND